MNGHELYKKYGRVPVVLSSKSIKLVRKRYLIAPDDCLSMFLYFLRLKKHINIPSGKTVYIRDRYRTLPSLNERIGLLYYHLKSDDGILHLNIERDVYFG